MSDSEITRRHFIKRGMQTGLGLSAISTGIMTLPSRSARGSQWDKEAEFIVIGSGAGGGTVAANLARAGYRVLLMEAGGQEENRNYRIPAFHGKSTEDPAYAWNYFVKHYSDPKRQQGYDSKYEPGRGIFYPRAGTLGGCTAHNAMITMYPDNKDWDDISDQMGDRSWNGEHMRHWFEKLEHCWYKSSKKNEQRHGYIGGWLNTEQTDPKLLLEDKALRKIVIAAAEAGHIARSVVEGLFRGESVDLDPNDWSRIQDRYEGAVLTPKATFGGVRNGARERILETKALYGDSLEILTGCLATRLIFREGTNEIIGVNYFEGGHLYAADPRSSQTELSPPEKSAHATREVILAGGAFNSPQLLLLSGIGAPSDIPKTINPKVPLHGVGKNLQDRYEVTVVNKLKEPLAVVKDAKFGEPGDPELAEYYKNPKGHVYGSNGVIIGFKKRSRRDLDNPDLFVFGVPGDFRGYQVGWADASLKADHFTWAVLKGHTKNTKGEVKLKDANPRNTPDINFSYFDEGSAGWENDLMSVVSGVEFARSITKNHNFQDVADHEVHPANKFHSIHDFVRKEAWGHHASCSNKMGLARDPMAVVNNRFQVHQVKNLRIVDASVFPKIPGLFIVLPIYMIAEKASQAIIEDNPK